MYRSDFVEETNDLVTLLSNVIFLPTSSLFKEWMFYLIEEILQGEAKFHYTKIISENLHNQFVVVKKTSDFYMTFYLVNLLTMKFPYKGLSYVRTLGTKKG